jgi:hypothetical protein
VQYYMTHALDLLGVGHDPSIRNVAALLVCAALYGAFIFRERGESGRRGSRPLRCPDSVLRRVRR